MDPIFAVYTLYPAPAISGQDLHTGKIIVGAVRQVHAIVGYGSIKANAHVGSLDRQIHDVEITGAIDIDRY